MPYLRMRDGAHLHVRIIGRGAPCVLLHGFGGNSAHWLPLIWPYLHRCQFILPDLRGFGRSHAVRYNQPCILTNYAEDLDDVLDHLGLSKVMLGGISMGAYTSLQYHRLTGFQRVSRYLHIDQSPQCRNRADWSYGLFGEQHEAQVAEFYRLLEQVAAYDRDQPFRSLPAPLRREFWRLLGEFFAFALHRPYEKHLARQVTRIEPLVSALMPTENWHAYVECLRAYLEQDYDMRPSIAQLSVPTTVMVGMRSEMYPYQGQLFIHDHAPDARLVRFENSGHALIYTEPRKFIRELGRFLFPQRHRASEKGFSEKGFSEKGFEVKDSAARQNAAAGKKIA